MTNLGVRLRAILASVFQRTENGSKRANRSKPSQSHIIRLSATDLAKLAICERIVYLKYHGHPDERLSPSLIEQAIQTEGLAHEQAVIDPSTFTHVPVKSLEEGVAKTLAAMKDGVAKIHQGVLRSDGLLGLPDLLVRIEKPSKLGTYRYCPVEIKSGQRLKPEHEIQVMAYLYMLEQIQGVKSIGIIQLGDNSRHKVRLVPTFNKWLEKARLIANGQIEPRPFIASYCNRCEWRQHCLQIAQNTHDISLIPDITKEVRTALHQKGIGSLPTLAEKDPSDLIQIRGIGPKSARMMVFRARAFLANEAIPLSFPSLSVEAVETYFDVESVQVDGRGKENLRYYLFGWCTRRDRSLSFEYEYELAESPEQENAIWQPMLERIDAIPGPVFHYTNYEKQAIKNLCDRYGTDPRAGRLLDRLVDLFLLVKSNIALPLESYSLKAVAPWLGYKWTGVTQTGGDTMIEYARWLRTGRRAYLNNILVYNEHDCRAMVVVKDWLAEFKP